MVHMSVDLSVGMLIRSRHRADEQQRKEGTTGKRVVMTTVIRRPIGL